MKKNFNRLHVLLYARVSSDKQAHYGDSLEYQIECEREYCKNRNHIIHGEYKDSYTGMSINRPKFQQLKKDIVLFRKQGIVIDAVIITKIDRLSRAGASDYDNIKKELKILGVMLIDVSGVIQMEEYIPPVSGVSMTGYDWAASTSDIPETIAAQMAYVDRKTILQRTIPQEIRNYMEGYQTGPADFGYRNETIISTGSGKKTIQVADEKEGIWMQEIYRLRAEGYPDKQIVKKVNALSFRTRKRLRWSKNGHAIIGTSGDESLTVKKLQELIKRPIYAGIANKSWGGEQKIVKCSYQGLVSVELWNKANRGKWKILETSGDIQILSEKDIPQAKVFTPKRLRENPKYPFSNLVYADESKDIMKGNAPKCRTGKRYPYYSGIMKTKRQLNVPQNEFEETIINYIESLQMEPKMIDLIMIMMERLWKAKKKDIDKGRQTQKAYLSELDAKEAEIHNCIPHIAKYENLLEGKNKELEDIKTKKQEVMNALEKNEKNINIGRVQEYAKKFIETIGEVISSKRDIGFIKSIFRFIFRETPTYGQIINRNTPLQHFFSLTSQQKTPSNDEVSKNTEWLPLAELFRTKYRDDITNLGRFLECHKGLKELLIRKSYTVVL